MDDSLSAYRNAYLTLIIATRTRTEQRRGGAAAFRLFEALALRYIHLFALGAQQQSASWLELNKHTHSRTNLSCLPGRKGGLVLLLLVVVARNGRIVSSISHWLALVSASVCASAHDRLPEPSISPQSPPPLTIEVSRRGPPTTSTKGAHYKINYWVLLLQRPPLPGCSSAINIIIIIIIEQTSYGMATTNYLLLCAGQWLAERRHRRRRRHAH